MLLIERYDMGKIDREEASRREIRRKRRVRNQIIAYVATVTVVLLIIVGAVFGGKLLLDQSKEKQQVKVEEEQQQTVTQEITEPETEVTEPEIDPLDELVDTNIAGMSLEEKVAGLFIVTPESITGVGKAIQAGDGTKAALEKYPVGGLVYTSKNIESEEQIRKMIDNTILYSKFPLFISVAEEGGSASGLGGSKLGIEQAEAAADIGAGGDASAAYNTETKIGAYLADYGFNLNFAPVADVMTNPENKELKTRAYSADAAVVSSMVQSAVAGLQDQNVSACMKHFPGVGDAAENTHDKVAVTNKTVQEMREMEFLPFMAGIEIGTDMIMAGHIAAPAVTGDNTPCSLSSLMITDVLRTELGYQGIIITDAMDVKSITASYSSAEASVKAIQAGVDMILAPEKFEEAYQGVMTAVQDGSLTEERINESLHRIYRVKYREAGSSTGAQTDTSVETEAGTEEETETAGSN